MHGILGHELLDPKLQSKPAPVEVHVPGFPSPTFPGQDPLQVFFWNAHIECHTPTILDMHYKVYL